jgi:Holliday junction resolvasome RuvABC ATP-dependent DNA helicase subunit
MVAPETVPEDRIDTSLRPRQSKFVGQEQLRANSSLHRRRLLRGEALDHVLFFAAGPGQTTAQIVARELG